MTGVRKEGGTGLVGVRGKGSGGTGSMLTQWGRRGRFGLGGGASLPASAGKSPA